MNQTFKILTSTQNASVAKIIHSVIYNAPNFFWYDCKNIRNRSALKKSETIDKCGLQANFNFHACYVEVFRRCRCYPNLRYHFSKPYTLTKESSKS